MGSHGKAAVWPFLWQVTKEEADMCQQFAALALRSHSMQHLHEGARPYDWNAAKGT